MKSHKFLRPHSIAKSVLLVGIMLLCGVVQAATVVVTWSAASNPAAGWNLYYNHLQNPDALSYLGSMQPQERSMTFYNIATTGLYQLAVSRVDYTAVAGVNRRTETAVAIITIVDGQLVSTSGDVVVTSVSIN